MATALLIQELCRATYKSIIVTADENEMSRGVARGGSKGSDEPLFQTRAFLNVAI